MGNGAVVIRDTSEDRPAVVPTVPRRGAVLDSRHAAHVPDTEADLLAAWPERCVVSVHGLQSSQSLNGRNGCVVGARGHRLIVHFGALGTKALLPCNLRRVIALCRQCGAMGPPFLQNAQDPMARCYRCDGTDLEEMQPMRAPTSRPAAGPIGVHAIREMRRGSWDSLRGDQGSSPQLVTMLLPPPGVAMTTAELDMRMGEIRRVLHYLAGFWAELSGQRGEPAPPPRASRAAVAALRSTKVGPGQSHDTCPVCMEPPEAGDTLLSMPCSHTFHRDCLLPWLEEHCTCPTCRHKLPAEED
eukprot:TRINITY_DN1366_c1_g3_i1.p1 TRINITY_DN1366_c1_g3~~TRINITY_DN1366_c1_g3_i1.p1  ORF type:complete len:300 (+),score=50.19 TRINITY_DN1366_c1_g3_i1:143-1042(+)